MKHLKKLWEEWKRIAHVIGNFQARVILTLVYVVFVLPLGLAVRLFSDPLHIKRPQRQWLDHPKDPNDLSCARRQG